jgi:hypothetical protein
LSGGAAVSFIDVSLSGGIAVSFSKTDVSLPRATVSLSGSMPVSFPNPVWLVSFMKGMMVSFSGIARPPVPLGNAPMLSGAPKPANPCPIAACAHPWAPHSMPSALKIMLKKSMKASKCNLCTRPTGN